MIAVLFTWLVISFVCMSFGDALLCAYNRIGKRAEEYNMCDVFIFGMFLVCGFLAFSSIGLPSNQYVLAVFVFAGFIYWGIRRKRLSKCISNVKDYYAKLTKLEVTLYVVALLVFLLYSSWTIIRHDSAMYHLQMVRWNEEYPAIPGLANIEERFGFNSNYFLISALFTFRFLFTDPLYCIQGLIGFYIFIWILSQITRSDYKLKPTLLLVFYSLFIYINTYDLRGLSSDIIPNMVIFYLFARIILNPSLIKNSFLFCLLVPVALSTFKLSAGMFCLVSVYPLVMAIRAKQYRALFFIVVTALFIVAPWLTRNVIMSGYLIFPLHALDLFSFDWKVPSVFLQLESDYITNNSKLIFYELLATPPIGSAFRYHLIRDIHIVTYLAILISPLVMAVTVVVKKKRRYLTLLYLYAVLLINIIFWFISAADPRFVNGALLITVFLVSVMLLNTERKLVKPRIYMIVAAACVFYFLFDTLKWIKTYSTDFDSTLKTLYIPKSDSKQEREEGKPVYTAIKLNNSVTIYLTDDARGKCYDLIPCVKEKDLTEFNFQDHKNLEARGNTIRDGFRYRQSELNNLD